MTRSDRGNAIVETPGVLWFLIVLILLPLMNLGTACVRAYFLYDACHLGVMAAAKARSFQVAGATPSAMEIADAKVRETAARFNGVRVNAVRTALVQTNIADHTRTVHTAKLATPPNTSTSTYQIRVTVDGSVEPFFVFNLGYFLDVPGLTAPINFSVSDHAFVENTQGLMR